ncbi:MAG: hypothetical protein WDN29_12440 [Methylovirgula sp.]
MTDASVPGSKIGVLLVNLGTPDATDFWSVRRYLKDSSQIPASSKRHAGNGGRSSTSSC